MLVRKEFDGGIGEDAQQGGRMPTKKPPYAVLPVDIAHGRHHAKPGAGILGELRVGCLEKNLDAVEGADDSFCLHSDGDGQSKSSCQF